MEKEITLQLSIEEINIIFQSLGQRPFQEVYELVGKINAQANRQMNENPNNNKSDNTFFNIDK